MINRRRYGVCQQVPQKSIWNWLPTRSLLPPLILQIRQTWYVQLIILKCHSFVPLIIQQLLGANTVLTG